MVYEKNSDQKWIGKRFGMLVVIGLEHKKRAWYWKCRCDCGNEITTLAGNVKQGLSKSCGCVRREKAKTRMTKHGYGGTRIYQTWQNMKQRCYNPNNGWYPEWGGRGICVCDEWVNNPSAFVEWANANGYEDGLTIERIDVNGNYEPSNCRWIPNEEQAWNRRNSRLITYRGETKCLSEWCKVLGVDERAVRARLNRGMDFGVAVTMPIAMGDAARKCREAGVNYHSVVSRMRSQGMTLEEAIRKPFKKPENSLREKCRSAGMSYEAVKQRINAYGWSEEEALSIPIGQKRNKATRT